MSRTGRWAGVLAASLALHVGLWRVALAFTVAPSARQIEPVSIVLVSSPMAVVAPQRRAPGRAHGAVATEPEVTQAVASQPVADAPPAPPPAAEPGLPLPELLVAASALDDSGINGGGADHGARGIGVPTGSGGGAQGGVGAGLAAAGDGSAGSDDCWADVAAELHARVGHLPSALKRRGLAGSVVARFALDALGQANQVVIERQSGSALVVEAVYRLLEQPFAHRCAGQGRFPLRFAVRETHQASR